ncbi:MAG: PQQ-like beta-propeller repeat protein [Candidatus Solibacter usitatus]|nr:PQQ-like beta-propeller repeat protein [Candidatus Solibacter usitatus]
MPTRREVLFSVAGASLLRGAPVRQDWPQWRGPRRDGLSTETGLLKEWPTAGPRQVWSVQGLGSGYGTVAIADDRIFVQGGQTGKSGVQCLDRASGKLQWQVWLGAEGDNDRGGGPRSTPTVEGDRLWALNESGDLACLDTANGSTHWSMNILRDFKGRNPHWLLSESPLIDGSNLICTPGGRGAGIVAVDKLSGKRAWSSQELSDEPGYASCIAVEVGGVRAITTLTSEAGVGVRASDGKLMWRYEKPANGTANCATPVFGNNKVFYSSAYGTGGGVLALSAAGGEVKSSELWFNREMMNHHGGVVLVNGYLYGFSNAILTCLEFETGKVMWKDRSVGKGSLTYADGQLYLLGESYAAGLAEASPAGYKEKGRFRIPEHGYPSWAHPVVCGGRLYIRNQTQLQCFDISAG